jgi:NADH:ubiquinone oxidoreductase subunit 5 (subunit L)/multisubunit Na+/H+ antiporter MnhA subunit
MFGDLNIVRFILLVLMFVVSIMFLIVSPNVISILLGWHGLGLVSYLLVIYYQNVRSYGAGMLTVLSNRTGDVALLIVIAWMINFGSWSFIYYLEFLRRINLNILLVHLKLKLRLSELRGPKIQRQTSTSTCGKQLLLRKTGSKSRTF